MNTPPQTTPNTVAPAVAATVEAVRVLGQSRDTTWLKVRRQPVQVFDFYAKGSA